MYKWVSNRRSLAGGCGNRPSPWICGLQSLNFRGVLKRQISTERNLKGGGLTGAVWRLGAAHVRFPWGSGKADFYGK